MANQGVMIQIKALGEQNRYLNGDPTVSHFKCVYEKYHHFAMEQIRQYIHGNVDFGNKVYCEIAHIGDLVDGVYLYLNVPELGPVRTASGIENLQWADNLGQIILEEYNIQIGEQIIERQYSQWIDIWNELNVPTGKLRAYNQMLARNGPLDGPVQLRIPLNFWFTRNKNCALPILCLQENSVRINITFRPFRQCVVPVDNNTEFRHLDAYYSKCCADPLTYQMWVDYIFLSPTIRKRFIKKTNSEEGMNYLIDQIQVKAFTITPHDMELPVDLEFTHPVIDMYWTVQRIENIQQNFWFNYSATISNTVEGGGDPITEARIQFDGQDRTETRDSYYFSTMIPYKFYENAPINRYIYVYTFSMDPSNALSNPAGSCNFGMIDNKTLRFRLSNELRNSTELYITVWARNYNLLRIKRGFAEIIYAT